MQLLRFVLIALFLFAYQSSRQHAVKHAFGDHSSCRLCTTSKQLDGNLKEIDFTLFASSFQMVEREQNEVRIEHKEPYDISQPLRIKRSDFTGLRCFRVAPVPLGYISTAPPPLFS